MTSPVRQSDTNCENVRMQQPPILVVGAGPTGLTMACELARHGAPVRSVDKLPGILPYARANGIHSRTLEVFQDLGVVDRFLILGQPIVGITQYANREPFDHTRFDQVDSPYPYTIGLEQWHTEEILEELLGRLGVEVERETELVALEERWDGVRATLRHSDGREETVDTPWLVGCDGAHSRVRHLNQQHFPGEADPRQYLVADVFVDAPFVRDEVHNFMSDRGILVFFPIPNGRSLLLADLARLESEASKPPDLVDIQALVTERGPARARVYDLRQRPQRMSLSDPSEQHLELEVLAFPSAPTADSIFGPGLTLGELLGGSIVGVGSGKLLGTPEQVGELAALETTGLDAVFTFRHYEDDCRYMIDQVVPFLGQMGVLRKARAPDPSKD